MIGNIRTGLGAHGFWSWFEREAGGYRNALEALSRGEADSVAQMEQLDRRVRRIHSGMRATVSVNPEGGYRLVFSGREDSLTQVLRSARNLPGWQIGYDEVEAAPSRRPARRKAAIRKAAIRRMLRLAPVS